MMYLARWPIEGKIILQAIKIKMQNGKIVIGFKGNKYEKKFIHILRQQ